MSNSNVLSGSNNLASSVKPAANAGTPEHKVRTETATIADREKVQDNHSATIDQETSDVKVSIANNLHDEAADKNTEFTESDELEIAITTLQDHVQSVSRDLSFRVDDNSGDVVVTVLDSSTQEVIRQIPREDAIELSRKVDDIGFNFVNDSA